MGNSSAVSGSSCSRIWNRSTNRTVCSMVSPRPLCSSGRVATLQNSTRFCGKQTSWTAWRRSPATAFLTSRRNSVSPVCTAATKTLLSIAIIVPIFSFQRCADARWQFGLSEEFAHELICLVLRTLIGTFVARQSLVAPYLIGDQNLQEIADAEATRLSLSCKLGF